MIEQFIVFIASYFANTMSALAGGGAGLVQLPVLLWMGLTFPVAMATHKIATVALGVGAVARISKEKALTSMGFALFLLATGMSGAFVGARALAFIPDRVATLSVGVFTIAVAIYTIFQRNAGMEYKPKNQTPFGYTVGGFVLFFIGFLSGSLSAGVGIFVTIWNVAWFGLDYKRAVAYTMICVGFFWNATGAITLAIYGQPAYWPWLPALLAGSILGGYTGAHMGMLKGNQLIKTAFVCVTLLSGLSLLFK